MVNKLVFQGRMVAEPELRKTKADINVLNFRVAWSKKIKDVERKCFLECKAWREKAEFISGHFHKGQEMVLCGELVTEEWEQEGQKRSKVVLYVDEVHFTGKKDSAENSASVPEGYTQTNNEELPF